jgi:hydroxymethylpyrimidine/phosphomethylpyrimidine kinase
MSGLVEPNAVEVMKRDLMPLCRLITPNLIELAVLAGSELAVNDEEALRQGRRLLAAGPRHCSSRADMRRGQHQQTCC